MLPKLSLPDSELYYHPVMLDMLELVVKIDDRHGYLTMDLINGHFGLKMISKIFRIIESKVVITGLYDKTLANANDPK